MTKLQSSVMFQGNGNYGVAVWTDDEHLHQSEHATYELAETKRRSMLSHYYYKLNVNDKKLRQHLANKKYLESQKHLCHICKCAKITKYAKRCIDCARADRWKNKNKGEK